MCTVLQQHLNRQNGISSPTENTTANGYNTVSVSPSPAGGRAESVALTPAIGGVSSYWLQGRSLSPPTGGRHSQPGYSYLSAAETNDKVTLKRPIDPYDRKISTPAMHFHVPPPNADGTRPSSRQMNAYTANLFGRRSRSQSRKGMNVLVDQLENQTPRNRSPHMNNEEPIKASHYPDGVVPEIENTDTTQSGENGEVTTDGATKKRRRKKTPIERDDFPAPPFPYSSSRRDQKKRKYRRRRWRSEPGRRFHGLPKTTTDVSSTDEDSHDEDSPYESSSSEIDQKEIEEIDKKIDKTEAELKKCSIGMAKVFLADMEKERERMKMQLHNMIDPRSAARAPAANRMPHYKLRFDDPVNASPSRIAGHLRPWDDEMMFGEDGYRSTSRHSRVTTPFGFPAPLGRVVSPVNTPKPGYTLASAKTSTLPSRYSPTGGYSSDIKGAGGYSSTDFSSKSDLSDGEGGSDGVGGGSGPRRSHSAGPHAHRVTSGLSVATPKSRAISSASTRQTGVDDKIVNGADGAMSGDESINRSMPTGMPGTGGTRTPGSATGSLGDSTVEGRAVPVAGNIYPLHLLYTTNYRLPGDVDRSNLERHMADADFETVFRMTRGEFYLIPHWKRCEIKRRHNLY